MVELTVGSRFWYKDKFFCEVVENGIIDLHCESCVFKYNYKKCNKQKCFPDDRHDGKLVYFKRINENNV